MKSKQKVFSVLIFFGILIVASLFAYLSNNKSVKVPENPFSFDLPSPKNSQQAEYYTKNDNINTIYLSSPYYLGNQEEILPGYIEYNKLKKEKVDETIKLTQDLYKKNLELKKSLEPFKEAYFDFTEQILKKDKKSRKYIAEVTKKITEMLINEEILIANYESINGSGITNPFASSSFEYQKTMEALMLGKKVTEDTMYLVSASAVFAELYKGDSELKVPLKIFETQMEKISSVSPKVDEIKNQVIYINVALKQIETGDYYLAKSSLNYVTLNLPELKKQIGLIKTSDNISKDDIELFKEYLGYMETFSKNTQKELDKINKKKLLPVEEINKLSHNKKSVLPKVYAVGDQDIASAFNIYSSNSQDTSSTLESFKNGVKSVASITWEGAKIGFNGAKTVVGVTLDTASAITKSTFDAGFGMANGNTLTEVTNEVASNFKRIGENYDKGVSGSNVLKDAGGQLEGAENLVTNALEGTIGEGRTSWGVGGLSKLTVGMFTGFGKGLYKIADKQATIGTLLEGGLDVGLSMIGGSKVLLQGTAGAGGKEVAKNFGSKMLKFVNKVGTNAEKGGLKILTGGEALQLVSRAVELEAKQAVVAEIKQIEIMVSKKLATTLKEGLSTIIKNSGGIGGTVAGNYKDFVKETFKHSLEGYKEALKKVIGNGFEDYIDNLVTGKIDDFIKSSIKVYIDASAYDGVYEKIQPFGNGGKQKLILKIIIENGSVSGGTSYQYTENKRDVSLDVKVVGSIDEKGNLVNSTWEGELKGGGPSSSFNLFGPPENTVHCVDNLKFTGKGNVKGSVVDKKVLKASLHGKGRGEGTFWCKEITDGSEQPLEEPIKLELQKIQ